MKKEDCDWVASKTFTSKVWDSIFNWTGTSIVMLRQIEKKILSYLKVPYRGFYVDIGPVVGENGDKVWTIAMNSDSTNNPLLMLHGLGAGVALWVLNLDSFANNRPVYAVDILGFGRSSRPNFANNAEMCERQFVKSIEEWRREMGIDKMIILGHSMGGYLATSYAISYPDRVKYLILADPWGFPERPPESGKNFPFYIKAIAAVLAPFNPLWALRAAGPFGQWVVEKIRPDITKKFSQAVETENLIPQYIHQCNSQKPSGEAAFHGMMEGYGYAKNPMIKRVQNLEQKIPVTLIYGSRSWVEPANEKIQELRPDSLVNIRMINGAGHHVYADKPDIFNQYVNEACTEADDTPDNTNKVNNVVQNSLPT